MKGLNPVVLIVASHSMKSRIAIKVKVISNLSPGFVNSFFCQFSMLWKPPQKEKKIAIPITDQNFESSQTLFESDLKENIRLMKK